MATAQTEARLTPENMLKLAMGFWGSKVLLSAVELGVFTEIASNPSTAEELAKRLGLSERGHRDFLDALVSLKLLTRDGGIYRNSPDTDLYLDKNKPTYLGGFLEMVNTRIYPSWANLTEALKTGAVQNETKGQGDDMFAALYKDKKRLELFLKSMSGISGAVIGAISEKFPWQKYQTFADVGTAQGALPVHIARKHAHLSGVGFDLSQVKEIFEAYVAENGLSDRVKFVPGDFFKGSLPSVDVIVMGHILHDWNADEKRMLVKKAFAALPSGGAYLVYDAMIDNERKENAFGLLMSLNMLVETPGGFDYTPNDLEGWLKEAGFADIRFEKLSDTYTMAIGVKP